MALEQMTDTLMARVEPVGVGGVQLLHRRTEWRVGDPKNQMKVVRHQAVRVTAHTVTVDRSGHPLEEVATVDVVEENLLPRVAARHHVIDCPGNIDAQQPRHGVTYGKVRAGMLRAAGAGNMAQNSQMRFERRINRCRNFCRGQSIDCEICKASD